MKGGGMEHLVLRPPGSQHDIQNIYTFIPRDSQVVEREEKEKHARSRLAFRPPAQFQLPISFFVHNYYLCFFS